MEDALTYEKKKVQLRKYIQSLDEKCKVHFGPHNKYIYPKSNPYTAYVDVADFKKRVLGDKSEKNYITTKTCKFIADASTRKDKKNRYYTDVQNSRECDFLKGHWDDQTLNRKNKVDVGTCWITEQDKTCGVQVKQLDSLRPYRGKYNKDATKLIIEEADRCNKTKGCRWEQQTAYTHDCVRNGDEDEDEDYDDGPVVVPPEEMPLVEFEEFLENWYLKKKYGKAPETGSLLGEGDRCNGVGELDVLDEDDEPLPPPPLELPEYIPFRALDPTIKKDTLILKNYMPENYFKQFKEDWQMRKKLGEEKWQKYVKQKLNDTDITEIFYNKMDKIQFETDYRVGGPKKSLKMTQKMLPSIPQSVMNMIMKNVAMKGSKKRGMLGWHSTGSGKTATATGIMDAFWDTDKQIIFASSIDAIASNPDFVFHRCAYNFFGRFQKEPYKGNDEAHSLALIAQAFKKRKIRFLSFAKLSNRVMKAIAYKKEHKLGGAAVKREKTHDEILASDDYVDLDKCIVIIDEVHNLFRPLANQKKQHEALEAELIKPEKHPGLKVVILTATPGDNIPDVLKLLNIVRDMKDPEIKAPNIEDAKSIETFKKQIRGLISYFDMSSDDTKFPKVIDTEPVKLPMSETQYAKYIEAYKKVTEIQKNYKALAKKNELGKYWEPARKYANMLFSMEKDMLLNDFSSKLPYVIDNIMKYPNEKHYLYSAFYTRAGYGGHGVVAVGKELEKQGYVKLTIQEAKKLNKSGKLPPPAKRYILVINTELGEEGGDSGHNLHELLKIYNHPENKNGELIHVMLASNKYNESIDLKAVGSIHVFESLVTMAAEKQLIGRAVRFCSFAQKDRSKGEWLVKLHRYVSDKPSAVYVDLAPKRQKIEKDIADLEEQIGQAGNKEAVKDAKKAVKDKEKEIAKIEKLVVKAKATEADVKELKDELKTLQQTLALAEKGVGEGKDVVAGLKAQIKEKNKELKALDKPKNNQDVEMVEERIREEAKERFKELFTVYQCMKEAAVDCRLLREFHEKTANQKINCF